MHPHADRVGTEPQPQVVAPDGLETAILLLIFNRPETTEAVFNSIRSVRPKHLYVAADGPRSGNEADSRRCEEARRIATSVDWPCAAQTLFRDENLGAGPGVASAITWFFDQETEGIILEDDCVPHPSFYRFCEELLSYYRDDPSVMHISGDNFQLGRRRGPASYYFSRFTHNWGWASWNRAWKHYDFELIPEEDRRHIWDAQWQLSVERNRGLSALPNLNLVQNIGFGGEATHTKSLERISFLAAHEMTFPLVHPSSRAIDAQADRFTYYTHFRSARFPECIWAYRAQDWLVGRLKLLKRKVRTG